MKKQKLRVSDRTQIWCKFYCHINVKSILLHVMIHSVNSSAFSYMSDIFKLKKYIIDIISILAHVHWIINIILCVTQR